MPNKLSDIELSSLSQYRNKARSFKRPRINEDGKPIGLDVMSLGPKGEPQVANGRWGIKSNLHVGIQKFGPQKGRRVEKRKKRGCKLASTGQILRSRQFDLNDLMEVRDALLTIRLFGDHFERNYLNPYLSQNLERLSLMIFRTHQNPDQIHENDKKIENQVKSQVKDKNNRFRLKKLYNFANAKLKFLNI